MKSKIFIYAIILCLSFILPSIASAADMYLVLDKSQVSINGTFTANVYISTDEVKVNNAEGSLFFPADTLSVDSVTTAGSVMTMWIEQPTFSNTSGIISFNGGVPNPGYSGQTGNILKVNFRAKKAGVASLAFGSSAIRANDGKGTNVFSQARGGSITVSGAPVTTPVPVTPTTPVSLPKAPNITSPDMPNADSWYNTTSGDFTWDIPSGVLAVQLVLSKFSDTVPYVNYQPAIKTKTLENLPEGKLFINARFRNSSGFGPIASRKIQIDLTKPTDLQISSKNTEEDTISLSVSAKDALSGVSKYEVYSGEEKIAEANVESGSEQEINLPPLPSGRKDITVKVFDRAGNNIDSTVSINPPATKIPKITTYPEFIQVDSKFEVQGKSFYGESDIVVWIKEEGLEAKSYTVKSNPDGIFSFNTEPIRNIGNVSVWAETIRTGNVKSDPSEKVFVNVRETKAVWFGTKTIQIISIGITVLVLILLFILLVLFIIRKSSNLKREMEKDKIETEQEMHVVFETLRKDIKRYLKMLERASTKRELTEEEYKIFVELSEEMEGGEKYLAKKIKDIG